MAQGGFMADVEITDNQSAPNPSRAEAVQARINADNARAAEAANQKGGDFDWRQLGMMVGGGLLAHALASSLVDNKSDEEKRRQSIWERLLAGIIPIGAAGLGAWGGRYLNTKIGAAGFVVDDTTNRYDRVSSNIPYARRIVQEAVDSAGGPHETLPLGPRMRDTVEKDLIPQTEGAKSDAESLRDWTGWGAGIAGVGTVYARKKWRDYAKQEERYARQEADVAAEVAKANQIMDQHNKATEAAAANAEALRQYQEAIAAKERELEWHKGHYDDAQKIRMGKKPTPEAAKVLTEAEAQTAALESELQKMRANPPKQQPVSFPTEIDKNRATKVLESQPLVPRTELPTPRSVANANKRVARGSTLAGAVLTAGLAGAATYNNYVANKQQQRIDAQRKLLNMIKERRGTQQ